MADDLRPIDSDRTPPDPAHLEETTWERLACDELDTPERDAALEHITSCNECSRVYRALTALRDGAAAFDPSVPAGRVLERPRRPVRFWAYGGAAAALAAGLVLVLAFPPPWIGQPAVTQRVSSIRGDDRAPVTLQPRGVVMDGPRQFRWESVTGADAYRVRVFSASGTVIWSSALIPTTAIDAPADLGLDAGAYFWDVSAHKGGEPVGQSALTRFEVRR